MVSVSVVDGVAVYELDTSGMGVGDYVISAEYIVNDSFNGVVGSGSLVLGDVVDEWVVADMSSSSGEWTVTPQSDGVHVSSSYVAYLSKIPGGSVLRITLDVVGGVVLDLREKVSGNSASLAFKNNEIAKWGAVGQAVINHDGIPVGSGVVVEISNGGGGVFHYKYSDGTEGTVNLNSSVLDEYYITFKNNGNGTSVVVTDMRYKVNT